MLPGDVLLVTGIGKLSTALSIAQKAIYRNAVSSHVEFSLGDGMFIHATNEGGVHLTLLSEEVAECKPGWRVLRHKSITGPSPLVDSLQKAGMHFFSQGYNKVYMGAGTQHSSFCSELVAKAYSRAGIEILESKPPSKVAPAHFDIEANHLDDWIDVTAEYNVILNDMKENDSPYQLARAGLSMILTRRRSNDAFREAMLERFENGSEKMKQAAREYRERLQDRKLDFWYEKNE